MLFCALYALRHRLAAELESVGLGTVAGWCSELYGPPVGAPAPDFTDLPPLTDTDGDRAPECAQRSSHTARPASAPAPRPSPHHPPDWLVFHPQFGLVPKHVM